MIAIRCCHLSVSVKLAPHQFAHQLAEISLACCCPASASHASTSFMFGMPVMTVSRHMATAELTTIMVLKSNAPKNLKYGYMAGSRISTLDFSRAIRCRLDIFPLKYIKYWSYGVLIVIFPLKPYSLDT